MGYYVEDCPKMNYKGAYGGELLDVCNGEYVSLDFLHRKQMISNGKLFVMDESETGTSSDSPLMRKLSAESENNFPSVNTKVKSKNIAENIYGVNGEAYDDIEQYISGLLNFDMPYLSEDEDAIYGVIKAGGDGMSALPNVSPGLLPLQELYFIVELEEITDLNGKLLILDTDDNEIRPMLNIYGESESSKRVICDLVRTLGLEITANTIVII